MSSPFLLAPVVRFAVVSGVLDAEQARVALDSVSRAGFDAMYVGDHVAFTGPINDPLLQVAYWAALAPKMNFGTGVYLLPLRHPTLVAKMVATVDRLLGPGRFIFGVGVGGEFAREYEACGVPIRQRGGRANEAIEVLRRLWTEPKVAHRGKYFSFGEIAMQPKPATPGGPPIW
ncbi:MAG: LLM class flavin-dependent oxidoreductase, partial [Candidatus Binataceae bacterium]